MDRSNTLAQPANDAGNGAPAARKARQPGRSRRLTRWQRLLGALVASAVLMSGVNALLQVARLVVEWKAGR